MMLADIYHHVLERSVSPEAAKIAISDAHLDGRLRLYCAERRERKTLPEPKRGPVFLEPGEKPQKLEAREEPAEGFGHPLPTPEIAPNCLIAWGAFDNRDRERAAPRAMICRPARILNTLISTATMTKYSGFGRCPICCVG